MAVASNPNACLSNNSSPSRAERQYSSNTSTFVSASSEPAASTSRLPQALHVTRQPRIQLLPIAPGALASSVEPSSILAPNQNDVREPEPHVIISRNMDKPVH